MKTYAVYWTEFESYGLGKADLVCQAKSPRQALSQYLKTWGHGANLRAFAEETDMGTEFYVPSFDRNNVLVREERAA